MQNCMFKSNSSKYQNIITMHYYEEIKTINLYSQCFGTDNVY
jgi:hypothetical protein